MARTSKIIDEACLSTAWAKAFLATLTNAEVSPLVVTVSGFNDGSAVEIAAIRDALDADLQGRLGFDSNTVANTIFPSSLWNPRRPRRHLFERYRRILPQIRACRLPGRRTHPNHYGIYFERLIAYRGQSNQLENIISTHKKGNHRFSGLQASVFDPDADFTDQRIRGFPCLQQVGFLTLPGKKLAVVGFYPKQHLYERGYGNYLGLCRLGHFMAREMGLELARMTCFIGAAVLGKTKPAQLCQLSQAIRGALGEELE